MVQLSCIGWLWQVKNESCNCLTFCQMITLVFSFQRVTFKMKEAVVAAAAWYMNYNLGINIIKVI